jgi:ADP-heptose:LPS heptosyltransferase
MIIIAPYAKKLRTGKQNPKDYPYWKILVEMIDEPIIQVGVEGEEQLVEDFRKNLRITELRSLIRQCRTWIGCDSFFQHLAWDEKKPGIVLWSVSDPLIFGHPENINLLKDRSYLAPNQFLWWEMVEHKLERFVEPEVVLEHLLEVVT